ncbi:MAG: ATP-dependent 26S proteasome regulatory subunit, partial [Myxococcota bacterium]
LAIAIAAPELSTDLNRAYRHAYADFQQAHGTPLFFEELLGEAGHSAGDVRAALDPAGPLLRYGLIAAPTESPLEAAAPPSDVHLVATTRLLGWLRDQGAASLPADGRAVTLGPLDHSLVVDDGTQASVANAIAWAGVRPFGGRRVAVIGPTGSGRRALIRSVAGGLVVLDFGLLSGSAKSVRATTLDALAHARLSGLPLYLNQADLLFDDDRQIAPRFVEALTLLSGDPAPLFVGFERGDVHTLQRLGPPGAGSLTVEIPFPSAEQQRSIWSIYTADVVLASDVDIDALSGRYSATGAKIAAAVRDAQSHAALREPGSPVIETHDLIIGIRQQLGHRLGSLASRVATPFTRESLVVEPKVLEVLDEIVGFFRQRDTLLERWGFGARLPYGRGLAVLFSGKPGTGKTMAASVLGRELGLEVFKVDLSQVVDKYIGETEKKLARLFDEAGRGQAILLFDEADSLFAKRTEVKSSTDRYANVAVNFLLQQMESYDGITVLTTNLEASLDAALMRRIRFKLEFPQPGADEREALWRDSLPPEAFREGEFALDVLADTFELSGSDIVNGVFKASARAAHAGRKLTFEDLMSAAEALYQARGKLVRRVSRSEDF